MSAPALAVQSSIQSNPEGEIQADQRAADNYWNRRSRQSNPEGEIQADQQQAIAQLAYSLWQQRGCPEGGAEQDWIEAEERLRIPLQSAAAAS